MTNKQKTQQHNNQKKYQQNKEKWKQAIKKPQTDTKEKIN